MECHTSQSGNSANCTPFVFCCVAWHLQALSNSIWALAHLKSRGMEVDALRHPDLMRFLTELAAAAARALVRPHATLAPPGSNGEPRLPESQRYLALVEREFSCQVRCRARSLFGAAAQSSSRMVTQSS
jgi:hypothetical protein